MYCPKCGAEQSDSAKFCTECGASISGATREQTTPSHEFPKPPAPKPKKPLYKRVWFWLLIVFVGIPLLSGIINSMNDNDVGKESYSSSQRSQSAPKKTTFGLNETAIFSTIKVTALEIKSSFGEEFFEPDPGNKFVGVKFEIENISDSDVAMSSLLLFDIYADDIKTDYSISANIAFGDGTLDGTIMPGKKMVGWMAVEVPTDIGKIEYQVKNSWLGKESATFVFKSGNN